MITYTTILEYTQFWNKMEKGFGGYGPFSKKKILQRIANKTRPVNQKSFFFLMMIACYQTQRPVNSGFSAISSS